MPGAATYASDVNVAVRARVMLDEAAGRVSAMESAQRDVIKSLLELWPISGWKAAGVRSAKQWLQAHTGQSWKEADRLERIARVCALDDRLADAVVSGRFPLGWAETLSRAVTGERARFLTDLVVDAFVGLADAGVPDERFADAVRFWRERAEERLAPRRIQPHSLVASPRLFGGGDVHMSLAPVAFETFMSAIDAFCQDPDPTDAPYQRTLSERRADAADDLAHFGLTHGGASDQGCGLTDEDLDDDVLDDDIFDGTTDGDTTLLDELLDTNTDHDEDDQDGPGDDWNPIGTQDDVPRGWDGRAHSRGCGDELDALRNLLRKRVLHRMRRTARQTRPRSAARVNIHIDLHTLAGTRDLHNLDGMVLRGEAWNLTKSAAQQLLCDSTLVATLFRGHRILDANTDADMFTDRQRRAIAARDHHCVFPGCRMPPRRCDTHHLWERNNGGPTLVANGCLLCRYHHRLLHQYRWTLRQNPDGHWIATDPHGHDWTERRPSNSDAARRRE